MTTFKVTTKHLDLQTAIHEAANLVKMNGGKRFDVRSITAVLDPISKKFGFLLTIEFSVADSFDSSSVRIN